MTRRPSPLLFASPREFGYARPVPRLRILFVSVALLVVALGCKKDRDTPPAAPTGGGSKPPTSSGTGKDGGTKPVVRDSGAEFDGGFDGGISTSGAKLNECMKVSPAAFLNGDISPDGLLNGISAPTDFKVTRVVATWRTSCVEPTLLIEMSEGDCSNPEEHRLQIQLDVDAIDSGRLAPGFNTLSPEPEDSGARFLYL